MIALWAEQDVVLADEFCDGNIPPGSGNRRLVAAARAALPAGVERIVVRGEGALCEQRLLHELDRAGDGYAISADMSRGLVAAIPELPLMAWQVESEDSEAVRAWAEVALVPGERLTTRHRPPPPRFLVTRITKKQGRLFANGGEVKHHAIVTNLPDTEGGSGLDLIRWQRGTPITS